MEASSKISIIIPCFNEEETLLKFKEELDQVCEQIPASFEYIFIDDGSTDNTLKILKKFNQNNESKHHYLSFSRNFGKESSMYAGFLEATGDYIAILDADLQDPPELLITMWQMLNENNDLDTIVAQRINRDGEPFLISFFSNLFYKIINKVSKTPVINGVRDYRLSRKVVVDNIIKLSEANRFSKGLFSWVGFNTAYITYENRQRSAGVTKWDFMSKVRYAWSGLINFSEAPLEFLIYSGAFVVIVVLFTIIFLILRQLFFHQSTDGWTSIIITILFCFGQIMISLGIIGKYISTIFLEVKNRPIFIIKDKK
ncbi:glycosyltransferase [Lactococcus lactis subsp. lactis]|uniref:glycosyltransferase family 2 protein n=1 Tax=Lactococcus lactis TaxID=1358 RepID=UPI00223B4A78|nr:glycosyltransferase family 2 protein [Lactococcus lactis]MCT0017336.1 glycosyltransferase [Lactococcus lactis subsp. lactis]